jgi:hypothetical protein
MCPIANRQTVLESAYPGEGPIFISDFFFFLLFEPFLYSSYNFPALSEFEHERTHF